MRLDELRELETDYQHWLRLAEYLERGATQEIRRIRAGLVNVQQKIRELENGYHK